MRQRAVLLAGSAIALLLSACQPAPAPPTPTTPAATAAPKPAASPAASPVSARPSPVVSPAAAASPDRQPANTARVRSPEYGIHTFLWGHPVEGTLARMKELNFGWQKTLFQWRFIESECKGCYQWNEPDRLLKASNQAGIKTIARVDFQPKWSRKDGAHNGPPDNYQDYADFIHALVDRYKTGSPHGHLHAVEIWNEPNLSREWGNQPINKEQAGDYVRLLKLSYAAAKKADPNVIVISAGLSPTGWDDHTARPDTGYLQWLYEAGMEGHFDVLGAHANSQAPDPEMAIGTWKGCDGGTRLCEDGSFYFRRVEQLREIMVEHGDANKQIWLLEFGWTADKIHPDYAWYAVSEEKKGENIVRAFQYARQNWSPWIGVMIVWTLPDPSWTQEREEYWWALTEPDGTPRASYNILLEARQSGKLP